MGNYKNFESNQEWATALFNYLVETGKCNPDDWRAYEDILHDANNFRGGEWLAGLERNRKTKAFFDYIPNAEYFEDEFVYGRPVSPDVLLKVATGKNFPENVTFDEVRDFFDENGLEELWDYPEDEIDEAIINLDENHALLPVGFYEEDEYFARIFEITGEMAERFNNMLVLDERGVYSLPCDIRPNLAKQINVAKQQVSSNKATQKDEKGFER